VTAPGLDTCGCCDSEPAEEPLTNRPGLASLSYRSGTHASILRRMLAALRPELRGADADADVAEDAGLALLDAWAAVADVVTFYQERIADEGYLRTATERRSVLELARSIGYELRPGVASAADLVFRVEDAEGAPRTSEVPAGTKVRSVPGQGQLPQTFETSVALTADAGRNEVRLRQREPRRIGEGTRSVHLTGVQTGLRAGDAVLVVGTPTAKPDKGRVWDLLTVTAVDPRLARAPDETSTTVVDWDPSPRHEYAPGQADLYAVGLRVALFGRNAPDWRAMPDQVRSRYRPPDGGPAEEPDWPGFTVAAPQADRAIDLEGTHPTLTAGSWLVLRQPDRERLYRVTRVELSARQDFATSGPTTRVELELPGDVAPLPPADGGPPPLGLDDFRLREVTALTLTRRLPLAGEPIDRLTAGPAWCLDPPAPALEVGRPVVVTGTSEDGTDLAETATVRSVTEAAGVITVTLDHALRSRLCWQSVRILGNVVAATHGETVLDEVLGSGDGAVPNQRFTLARKPLTHVRAGTPRGVESTLEVRVDGVRWTEVPSLLPAGPRDRVLLLRLDEEARATVVTGDGLHGARLPTGLENVHARYRTGAGPEGDVDAGTLTLLAQRPLGIASVTNPVRASGGTAAETLADARTNAPLTVLTLDRVVSLRDHEDYARSVVGIGKARAVALWGRRAPFVHLTVAGPEGAPLAQDAVDRLRDALGTVRDPTRAVQVDRYEPKRFTVSVEVLTEPAHRPEAVHEAVQEALRTGFRADRRSFGQPVTASEVLATVQAVAGVDAARLTELFVTRPAPPASPVVEVIDALDARLAPEAGEPDRVLPAELLLVDEDRITVTEMAP
jgi:predicted phage baseplate assembly protein